MNAHAPVPCNDSDPPQTIRRLRSLKRGEVFVYYRGNFEADINRAEPGGSGPYQNGAPKYAKLLRMIRDEAVQLQNAGKIRISETLTENQSPWGDKLVRVAEYSAIGLVRS